MADNGSITRLILQITSGKRTEKEDAALAIWQRYSAQLLVLARQHLAPRIRRREDENDVLQNMFLSFCRRAENGQFVLDDRNSLWNLLVAMTVNKARHVLARHARQKRSVAREHLEPSSPAGEFEIDDSLVAQLRSLEPSPEDAVQLTEGLEKRLEALGDPIMVDIALWKLEGYRNNEIATKLGCVERTVERKLLLIRRKWEEYLPE